MIRTDVIVQSKRLDVLATLFKDARETTLAAGRDVFDAERAELLNELAHEPGPVKRPIQWTSEKQRRAVMAKLRKQGNIPYQRTQRLSKSWFIRLDEQRNGFAMTIANSVKYAPYVVGNIRRGSGPDPQQRFHKNTGWFPVALTIDFWLESYTEAFTTRFTTLIRDAAKKG